MATSRESIEATITGMRLESISAKTLEAQRLLVASVIQRTVKTLTLLQDQPQRKPELEDELVRMSTGLIMAHDIRARYGLGVESTEWLARYDSEEFTNWVSHSNLANFMKFSKGIEGYPGYSDRWMLEVVDPGFGWNFHIPVDKVESVVPNGTDWRPLPRKA